MKGLGLRKLSDNMAATLARQLAAGLLQLIILMIIARVYGPTVNGVYAVAIILPGLLVVFLNLGIGSANVYYLGSAQFSPRKVLKVSIKAAIVLTVIGMSLGGAIIYFKAEAFSPGVPNQMLWLALFCFPFSLMQSFISSIYQGLQKFREFNITLLAQPVIMLGILVGLVGAEILNPYYLIVAHFVGILVTLFFSIVILRRFLKGNIGEEVEVGYTRKAINYGYKAHLSKIMAFVNYKADIFLVNIFLSPASAGVYVIAVHISERLWILSQAVSTVLLPRLAELKHDEHKRLEITPFITRITLFSTALLCIALALLAKPLIKLIFGVEYLDAYIPLLVLLPGIVLTSASRILANDLAARGMPELNMYTSIFVVVCNIIGNIFLIPLYGLFGAALATTLAYILNLLLRLLIYHHITKVPILRIIAIRKSDIISLLSECLNNKIV